MELVSIVLEFSHKLFSPGTHVEFDWLDICGIASSSKSVRQAAVPSLLHAAESKLQGTTSVLIRSGISPTRMRDTSFIVSTSMADTDLAPHVET